MLLVGLTIIAVFGWGFYAVIKAFDAGDSYCETPKEHLTKWGWITAAILTWAMIIGGCTVMAAKEEEKGPCLRHETGWAYNAATKTNMPYTYCVERGEWVKDEN